MDKFISLLRYFWYYIAINVLIAVVISENNRALMINVCTTTIAVSFIAALIGLFKNSGQLKTIENFCLKLPFVLIGVVALLKISFMKLWF